LAEACVDKELANREVEICKLREEMEDLKSQLEELNSQMLHKDQVLNEEKEKCIELRNTTTGLETNLNKCREDLEESKKENENFQTTVSQLNTERSNLEV